MAVSFDDLPDAPAAPAAQQPAAAPAVPTFDDLPDAPLPRGYVGEGKPYQGGWDWRLGDPKTSSFYPDRVRVPGQGMPGALGAAAAGELERAAGQIAAAPPRIVQGFGVAGKAFTAKARDTLDRIDAGQPVAPADDPLGYQDMTPEQRAQARAQVEQADRTPLGGTAVAAGRLADSISQGAERDAARRFPVDPKNEGLMTRIAGLAGGSLPYVVGTVAGGLPGAAATAFLQSYETTYSDAVAHKADPETAHAAATRNALLNGGLMTVPAAAWLGKFTPPVQNAILGHLVESGIHAGAMIGTTQLQQVANNLTARAYDPNRPLGEGVGEGMVEQGVVGAAFPALGSAARAVGRGVRNLGQPVADPALRASIEAQQQAFGQANERIPGAPGMGDEPPGMPIGPRPPPPEDTGPAPNAPPRQPLTPAGAATDILGDIAAGRPPQVDAPAASPPADAQQALTDIAAGRPVEPRQPTPEPAAETPPPQPQAEAPRASPPAAAEPRSPISFDDLPEAPKPQGTVRLYHGGEDPAAGGPRWVTADEAYARGYADKSGSPIHAVDLPADHPEVQAAMDHDAVAGTDMPAPIRNFEASEEVAKQLRPLDEPSRGQSNSGDVPPLPPEQPAGLPQDQSVASESPGSPGSLPGSEAPPALVEHTTKKGKVLRGTVRPDLTRDQAKALDPFTFRKGDGWFIREGKEGTEPAPGAADAEPPPDDAARPAEDAPRAPETRPETPSVAPEPARDAPAPAPDAASPESTSPDRAFADRIGQVLDGSYRPLNGRELQRLAEETYGQKLSEGLPRDRVYDAIELAVNRHILANPDRFSPTVDAESAKRIASQLEALKDRIPTQTVRAGEKDAMQQFSTPPDYAYAAAWLANLRPTDRVLEPSAGTGGLAVHAMNAHVEAVYGNELSEKRRAMLGELPFTELHGENAEQLHNILPDRIAPTAVVMNPPFSATERMAGKKVLDVGAQHVEQALKRLEPGGRLVAIVGRGMGPEAPTFRDWWKRIGADYDVRANVGMGGGIYRKYGTTFPTRVLVIDKQAPSGRPLVKGEVQTTSELIDRLAGVRDERPAAAEAGAEPRADQPDAVESSRAPVADEGAGGGESAGGVRDPARGVGDRGGEAGPSGPDQPVAADAGPSRDVGARDDAERPGGVRADDAEVPGRQSEPGSDGGERAAPGEAPRSEEPGRGGGGGGGSDLRSSGGEQPDLRRVEPPSEAKLETGVVVPDQEHGGDLTEAVYEPYRPQRLRIEGAQPHPGALVQSAAMATVLPPEVSYRPSLPADLVRKGGLSEAQLEAVTYAGAAHDQMLPPDAEGVERRRGFFIGDGTGVGKGREVSGIILDNFRQGRKRAVWVSEKMPLVNDAKRDWSGLGGDPNQIQPHNKIKAADAIPMKEGVLFTTYDTLKSGEKVKAIGPAPKPGEKAPKGKSRVDQIVDWLGKDFDGVIAYDEAHNMGNAIATKGSRGLKEAAAKAIAGIELQNRLPKARVVYISATGATEVSNLAYANRLGLWGRGTAFADQGDFLKRVSQGGVAAMELVARDMKALGAYTARNLSYDGVEYTRLEHKLSAPQRAAYDKIAEGWQHVLGRFNEALALTGADGKGGNKSAVASAFWGAHQRFFNQLITSLQMPSVLKGIERDIAEGRQAVLQLVNTNEAGQERALDKARASGEPDALDDLDMSPRDQLMQMVERTFPVQQFESYVDENGNERVRPVVDKNGNAVLNKEAVARREKLLDELGSIRVPDGPLEILMDHFGPEAVAEVTGRKQRVVSKPDEKGQIRKQVEKRNGDANIVDAKAFQDGRKKILVFSQAGGTGRSYHADNSAPSAGARRSHYLGQAGWRADAAVQGFGRTHRTNQASAPIFHLVTTDLEGQKRFISSIARRLAQLGALTKGERRTGDQGLFGPQDNLEGDEAKAALGQFFREVFRGGVPGVPLETIERKMGLNLTDATTGGLRADLPPMSQFLNRVLSLGVQDQNRVFGAFADRFRDTVEAAQASGTLDAGVETYRADRIDKAGDQVVYTDPRSGAETRHVHLKTHTRNQPVGWEDIQKGHRLLGGKPPEFYIKTSRGNVLAAVKSSLQQMDANGTPIDYYRVSSPLESHFVQSRDMPFDRRIQPDEAEKLWRDKVATTPEFRTSDLHLITGAVLPVWDRLQGSPKVYRLQTSSGERMLGRVVDNRSIRETLKRLGAGGDAAKIDPVEAIRRVMGGDGAELANGWKLKRSLVSGDQRIELTGPSYPDMAQLQQDGVYTERIGYQTRYFIPGGDQAEGVLRRITANRPIVDLGGDDGAQFSLRGKAAPQSLLSFIHAAGGIRDDAGELRSRDMAKRRPGLVSNRGRTLDYMREAAEEAGYLRPGSDINDLLNAMDEELSGRKVYAAEDMADAQQAESDRQAEVEHARQGETQGEVEQRAREGEIPLQPGEAEHAAGDVMQGESADAALHNAARAGDEARMAETEGGLPWEADERPPSAEALRRIGRAAALDPSLTTDARDARLRAYQAAEGMMRFMGLPERVGLNFVDKLESDGRGAADASYSDGLVTYALDTEAKQGPSKVWHEAMHALMDPKLGLLTDGQRAALYRDADRWLAGEGRRRALEAQGYRGAELRDEAVSAMAEDALARGLKPQRIADAAIERMQNFAQRLGQVARGQGWRTGRDVLNGLMRGDRAQPGSRESMVPRAGGAPSERQQQPPRVASQQPDDSASPAGGGQEPREAVPAEAPPPSGESRLDVMDKSVALPDRYFALRNQTAEKFLEAARGSAVARHGLAALDAARKIRDSVIKLVAPIATGSTRAQAYATRFANAIRSVDFQFAQMDRAIVQRFKADAREGMWRAMDAQSVFEQQLAQLEPAERAQREQQMRAEFDSRGEGIAALPADQRAAVEQLAALGSRIWERMRERGMVGPEARGLPFYAARQIVMRDEGGGFSRAGGQGGGAGGNIAPIGRNLTTAGPMRREHLLAADTERGAKGALGANAMLVRDIRTVVSALQRNERAIAGTDLMNAIEKVGRDVGVQTVVRGDIPGLLNPADYFTIEQHPSFRQWTGSGWRAIHVAKEFEGPLRGVMNTESSDLYKLAMKAKGGIMSAIMYSPFMHLAVELGRAFPTMPGTIPTVRFWRNAHTAMNDADFMRQATREGLAPIGRGWRSLDPATVASEAQVERNPKTGLGKAWDAVKKANEWKDATLLWDRVFQLQVGIYDEMRRRYVAKGFAPEVAGTMASHIANRYAGALPAENLSKLANQAANLTLFSRSFTLGNLGVMKDMFNGAPRHLMASIERMSSPEVAQQARAQLKRKAQAAFALDIGVAVLGNALLQQLWSVYRNAPDLSVEGLQQGAQATWDEWHAQMGHALGEVGKGNPFAIFGLLPQHHNEPGKAERIYLGNDSEGRGVYMRSAAGKVGEEFLGYMTQPAQMFLNKLSPFARGPFELLGNQDYAGRQIYKPTPHSASEYIENAGLIVAHLLGGTAPIGAVQAMKDAVAGPSRGDRGVAIAKAALPWVGGSISMGRPGGPEVGAMQAIKADRQWQIQQAIPKAQQLVRDGKADEAFRALRDAGTPPREAAFIVRRAADPRAGKVSIERWMMRNATAEERERVGITTGASR